MRLQLRLCLFDHRSKVGAMVIAVKDFHPANHCSFNTQGGWLPEHCIQGTPGSNFIPSVAAALDRAYQQGADRVQVVAESARACSYYSS